MTSPSNETGARRVGRPALRKKGAFTAAERQRRHRARLAKDKSALGVKAEQQKRRLRRVKAGEDYIPSPPGITYWRWMHLETVNGPVKILQPLTRPLAALEGALEDEDIVALLRRLLGMAKQRNIDVGNLTPNFMSGGIWHTVADDQDAPTAEERDRTEATYRAFAAGAERRGG